MRVCNYKISHLKNKESVVKQILTVKSDYFINVLNQYKHVSCI